MKNREPVCHESLGCFFFSEMCESKELSHAVEAKQTSDAKSPSLNRQTRGEGEKKRKKRLPSAFLTAILQQKHSFFIRVQVLKRCTG